MNGSKLPHLKKKSKKNNLTIVQILSYCNLFIFQLEGGVSHLPLDDSSMRATPITPAEWRKRVEAVNNIDVSSPSNLKRDVILLDVRNGTSSLVYFYYFVYSMELESFFFSPQNKVKMK